MSVDRSRIQDILSNQLTELQGISCIQSGIQEGDITYTATLYVSTSGDNSDGLTWSTAFNSIATAYNITSANVGDNTLILIGVGLFDVNLVAGLAVAKNVAFIGQGYTRTIIRNSHASNTYVFSCSKPTTFKNLQIMRVGTCDGIRLEAGAWGSIIDDVRFNFFTGDAGAGTALKVSAVLGCKFTDVWIKGDCESTLGIVFVGSGLCLAGNTNIFDCDIGINLTHTDDDNNQFENTHISNCALALSIDVAGAINNHFDELHLHDNVINIVDDGTNTLYVDLETDNEVIDIMPETASAGTIVTSKNVADTYGDNYSQIDDGSGFTKPFKIVGAFLGNPSDAAATYIVKLATGAPASEVDMARMMLQAGKFASGSPVPIESGVLPAGTRISANCQTENAVADDIEIWLLYIEF